VFEGVFLAGIALILLRYVNVESTLLDPMDAKIIRWSSRRDDMILSRTATCKIAFGLRMDQGSFC
jgi:hypothetical protein